MRNEKQVEECVIPEMPRYEEQKLDSRDYAGIVAEASAARGAIKGFIGGSLITIASQMFRTSTANSKIKPFFGGIIGTAGIMMTVNSFDEWKDAAWEMTRYIRFRINNRDHKT